MQCLCSRGPHRTPATPSLAHKQQPPKSPPAFLPGFTAAGGGLGKCRCSPPRAASGFLQPQLHQQQQEQHERSADVSRANDSNSTTSSSSNCTCTDVESSSAAVMVAFLSAYGVQPDEIQRLLRVCPQLFFSSSSSSSADGSSSSSRRGCCTPSSWWMHSCDEDAAAAAADAEAAAAAAAAADAEAAAAAAAGACTSVYEVGRTLLFFHNLGWSHSSVLHRIVGLYPQLLTKQVDRDILPVVQALSDMGCSQDDLTLLVWEFPRIFCSSNWRRHVRKFQVLGLYGLPPPGHSSSSGCGAGAARDSLERLLRWL